MVFTTFSTETYYISDNIITNLPGVVGSAKIITSSNLINFWNILFDNEMIVKITDYTNLKVTELLLSYGDTSTNVGTQLLKLMHLSVYCIYLVYSNGAFKI